jgi:hypothetical protein
MKLHLNVDGWKKPPKIVEKSQPCVGMSIIGKAEENVSKYQIGVASSDLAIVRRRTPFEINSSCLAMPAKPGE